MPRQLTNIEGKKILAVLKIAKNWYHTSIIKCHAYKQIKIILQKAWLFQMKQNIFCESISSTGDYDAGPLRNSVLY